MIGPGLDRARQSITSYGKCSIGPLPDIRFASTAILCLAGHAINRTCL